MSAAETIVQTRREGAVQVVTLNRPAARNAVNAALLMQLREALEAAARDTAVRAVLLTGAGKVFCAGGDLREIFHEPTPASIKAFLDVQMRPVLRAMMTMGKPVVVALNGPVAGAGIGIALAADIVIAAERASFVPAFGKVGAMADSAVIYLMTQNIGLLRTKDIIFRNRILSAQEATDIGLYTRTVADAELAGAASEIAAEVAAGPTVALGLAKHALRDATRMSFDTYMDLESLSMALINTTSDQREGIRAFMEKRSPVFAGR